MTHNRDAGTSSAAAFLLILAAIAVTAGLWGLLVLPAEQHAAAEEEADYAQTLLIKTRLGMAESAKQPSLHTIPFGVLFPKGTLTTENRGILQIEEHSIPLTSLELQTGVVTQGITAGGIWRKDSGGAAWILPPETRYEAGVLSLELPVFTGDAAWGSSAAMPFVFSGTGVRMETVSGSPITMTVCTLDAWVQQLWKAYFTELSFQEGLTVTIQSGSDRVTAVLSAPDLTVQVTELFCTVEAGGTW